MMCDDVLCFFSFPLSFPPLHTLSSSSPAPPPPPPHIFGCFVCFSFQFPATLSQTCDARDASCATLCRLQFFLTSSVGFFFCARIELPNQQILHALIAANSTSFNNILTISFYHHRWIYNNKIKHNITTSTKLITHTLNSQIVAAPCNPKLFRPQ